ncbi:hypothetical protein T06_16181 [Trichinella sp. T6]|nr:hypothetical protein T06_16181 [Trichinella sp. T6]
MHISSISKGFCITKDLLSSEHVSYPSLTSRLKSHHCTTFLQHLGKYAFVRHATSFWKVPWQTNLNLLNKWPLIFACAYLNTQESSPFRLFITQTNKNAQLII